MDKSAGKVVAEMNEAFESVRREVNDSLNSLHTAASSLSFADDTTRQLAMDALEDSVFYSSANGSSIFSSSELLSDDLTELLDSTKSVSDKKLIDENDRFAEVDSLKFDFNTAGKRFESGSGLVNVRHDKIAINPVSKHFYKHVI